MTEPNSTDSPPTLGRAAFEAFQRTASFARTLSEDDLRAAWDALPIVDRSAWQAAALAVADASFAVMDDDAPFTDLDLTDEQTATLDANGQLLGQLCGGLILGEPRDLVPHLIDTGVLQVREVRHNPVDTSLLLLNAEERSTSTLERLLQTFGARR